MPHRASHGHAPILRADAVRRTGSRAARGLWYSASLPGKAGPFSRGGPVPLRNPRPVPRRPDGTDRPPFPYAASAMDSLPFQPPCPTAGIPHAQQKKPKEIVLGLLHVVVVAGAGFEPTAFGL